MLRIGFEYKFLGLPSGSGFPKIQKVFQKFFGLNLNDISFLNELCIEYNGDYHAWIYPYSKITEGGVQNDCVDSLFRKAHSPSSYCCDGTSLLVFVLTCYTIKPFVRAFRDTAKLPKEFRMIVLIFPYLVTNTLLHIDVPYF